MTLLDVNASSAIRGKLLIGLALVLAGCSATGSTNPPDNDVAKVTVRPAIVRGALNGFEGPFDTVAVVADVQDSRGNVIPDRLVTWRLQLPSGAQASDTIATITSTGTQKGVLIFRIRTLLGIVASVSRNDGVSRSGTLYVAPDP